MITKSKLLVTLSAATLVSAFSLYTGKSEAHMTPAGFSGYTGCGSICNLNFDEGVFAKALAARFKLNENEVRDFMNSYHHNWDSNNTNSGVVNRYSNDGRYTEYMMFIDNKLDSYVGSRITRNEKDEILTKLREMMAKAPDSQSFLSMNYLEQRKRINDWKKEMDIWLKSRGLTTADLRGMTGKGNKYLMGISF